MDFKKLEKINEKAYTTSNIELLLDEYLELFQNTVASIKNRESFEREEDYLKKILFSTRIKRNKYSNYREFVALIVARIVKITEDYNTTNYLMRKNINEENIELFYFYAKNNQASIPELQNDIDDFYEKMKYEAREKFIISSIYDGEKVFLEEKNFYYGSCKTASKKIKDLAISYRLKPRLLLEEVKRKIEQRDIMDLHKLVYKYLEVTGDFDTELLYTVFRFLLKNKISKPVFEMLELYTLRFKMRTSLDANLMLYVCSYCKGSKKRVKLELYLKSLEIYLYKKPIDTVMALIYIGTLIDNYPYEAKEKFIKYLKSIPQKDIAYIFLENIIPKIPEEWSFKPIELKKNSTIYGKGKSISSKE